MGYSEDSSMVRVDFFKPTGKWYTTEAVKWLHYNDMIIQDAFLESLKAHFGDKPRLSGMWAVCLHPYHEHGHPIMVKVPGDYYA